MVPGLSHDIVVRFLPSCYPDSATSTTHHHELMAIRMNPYGHPLHQKVLKYFRYIKDICVIRSEGVPCLSLDIVVRFVPRSYPDSASSTHLHEFDGHKDASIWTSTASEGA